MAYLAVALAIFAGFEAGMVFAVRVSSLRLYILSSGRRKMGIILTMELQSGIHKGNHAPVTFFGVATSVVLSAGLLYVFHSCSFSLLIIVSPFVVLSTSKYIVWEK